MLTKDDVTMLVFAYRYACPRYTYAPDIVCDYIIDKIPEMNTQQREEVLDEVNRTLRFKEYADDGLAIVHIMKLKSALEASLSA